MRKISRPCQGKGGYAQVERTMRLLRWIGLLLPTRKRKMAHREWHGQLSPGLWGEIEDALSYCHGETPYQALNRYARKHITRGHVESLPQLNPENCTVRDEVWNAEHMMERLQPAEHQLIRPRDESRPILILKTGCKYLLLDGRTRVNKWTSKGSIQRRVIIIESYEDALPSL